MTLKFDEKIKLDNFAAQLHSIRSNIQIANSELEKVLREKKVAEDSHKELTKKVELLKDELLKLTDTREQYLKEMEAGRLHLEKRTEELKNSEEETSIYVATELARLNTARQEIESHIARRETELRELEEQKKILEESVGVLGCQVASLSTKVSDLASSVSELERETAALEQSLAASKDEHRAAVQSMQDEIVELQRIRQEEQDKIVMSEDYYAKKDAEYARRERDILVVTRRLKELFNEVKPGVALKI